MMNSFAVKRSQYLFVGFALLLLSWKTSDSPFMVVASSTGAASCAAGDKAVGHGGTPLKLAEEGGVTVTIDEKEIKWGADTKVDVDTKIDIKVKGKEMKGILIRLQGEGITINPGEGLKDCDACKDIKFAKGITHKKKDAKEEISGTLKFEKVEKYVVDVSIVWSFNKYGHGSITIDVVEKSKAPSPECVCVCPPDVPSSSPTVFLTVLPKVPLTVPPTPTLSVPPTPAPSSYPTSSWIWPIFTPTTFPPTPSVSIYPTIPPTATPSIYPTPVTSI
jgi:hypothetical protein